MGCRWTLARYGTTAAAVASSLMSREEALFWLSLAITVLQLIYDFYKVYTDPNRRKPQQEQPQEDAKA